MLKNLSFLLLGLFILSGCTTPSSMIEISPKITLPQKDLNLLAITISITGADKRQNHIVTKVTRNNQQVSITANRDLRFLLQEALEKQMIARGYMIGSRGDIELQIIINDLCVDISQGNFRYNISTSANIAIFATAKNGKKMIKHFYSNYSVDGFFYVANKNIADSVNIVLTNIIDEMAKETSIYSFIKQNYR